MVNFLIKNYQIKNEENKIIIQDNLNNIYKFDKLIICTGLFSNKLTNMLGETFPMISERGYHLMYNNCKNIISRPISVVNKVLLYSYGRRFKSCWNSRNWNQ